MTTLLVPWLLASPFFAPTHILASDLVSFPGLPISYSQSQALTERIYFVNDAPDIVPLDSSTVTILIGNLEMRNGHSAPHSRIILYDKRQ